MDLKKVVIAPDSFKGTMSSAEAGKIMEKAVKSVFPDAGTDDNSIAFGQGVTVLPVGNENCVRMFPAEFFRGSPHFQRGMFIGNDDLFAVFRCEFGRRPAADPVAADQYRFHFISPGCFIVHIFRTGRL